MKRSFLLLLMLLSSLFTSQSYAAKWAAKGMISEHFYTTLVSESESHNYAAFFAGPINDACANAIALPVSPGKDCIHTTRVDMTGATVSGTGMPTACDTGTGINNANDVWYKFTATGSKQAFTVTNPGPNMSNVRMVVYRVKNGNITYKCGDPQYPFGVGGSIVDCAFTFTGQKTTSITGFVVGQEYYIRFYTKGLSTAQFDFCISTPFGALFVSPSGEAYSVDELIKDVFIQAEGCDLVSNVRYKAGDGSPATRQFNSFGYFAKNGSDFPFEEGIVLSTTEVKFTPGPYNTTVGRGGSAARWPGDKDLNDAILSGGPKPTPNFRSTEVEFEFRPVKDKVSFEYLFASNSYDKDCGEMSDCRNGAMFAAWLIDPNGNGGNLALVPGTTDPITIMSVRDPEKIGRVCAGVHYPEYYGKHYSAPVRNPGVLAEDAPINYAGLTAPMKSAEVNVVPGKLYRIKLAVMDFCGTPSHNSAVFFNAGSFDIGKPSLGDNMTIEDGNAVCAGGSVEIGKDIDPNYYTISWYKNGSSNPIPGETKGTLKVTQPGSYTAKLEYKDIHGCETILGPMQVDFYDDIVIDKVPQNIEVCKSNDLSSQVNLMRAVEGVTFTDVEYSFHENESDAEIGKDGAPFIDEVYDVDNSLPGRTIWVRLQQTGTSCFKVFSFYVKLIKCEVYVVDLPDMHQCAVDGVTDYVFDLTTHDAQAGNGVAGVTVTYHTSQAGAIANNDVITNPANYVGTNREEIWVRVYDATLGKYATTSFKLYIDPLPVLNPKLTPFVVCTDAGATTANFELRLKDTEILQSRSGFTVEYYATQADADGGQAQDILDRNTYISGAKTIYYRIKTQKTGCFIVGSLELGLSENLVVTGNSLFYACSATAYGDYDLNMMATTVINGNTHIGNWDFYQTQTEADAEVNRLDKTKLYTNGLPGGETIYLRLKGINGYCDTVIPVILRIAQKPKLSTPEPIEVCTNAQGGVDILDVTIRIDDITASLNKDELIIGYYSSFANADAGTEVGKIVDPEHYSIASGTMVYVRVASRNSDNCASIMELPIIVNTAPKFNVPTDLVVCDDVTNDGFATFDLFSKKVEINKDGIVAISFYETKADAEADANRLNETAYTNTQAHVQQIWFRVENTQTGCFSLGNFKVKVNEYPKFDSTKGGIVTACTTAANSQAVFNILAGARLGIESPMDYDLAFYLNLHDAESNSEDRIRNPEAYPNTAVNNPTVYVRIESQQTGCVGIYEIKLIAYQAPVTPGVLPTIVTCDSKGDQNDFLAMIDLTGNEQAILAGVSTGHTGKVYYYTTKANAVDHKDFLTDPTKYSNILQNETIYYRVVDEVSGCYTLGQFDIEVITGIRLITPLNLIECSIPELGQNKAYFDLTTNKNGIINNIVDYGIDFKYYESEKDALDKVNAIPQNNVTKYVNKTTSQNIWIVVTGDNGCSTMVVQTIVADALPTPVMNPKAVEACEGEVAGTAEFDLTVADYNIAKGDTNVEITYYETVEEASVAEENLEPLPMLIESTSTTIYARVINKNSIATPACYVIVPIELTVLTKPYLDPALHYVYCLADEQLPMNMEFNLQTKKVDILDGRNANDFKITYYKTEEEAVDNGAQLPYIYTNETATKQTIYVRIVDLKTGCVNIGPMVLAIEKLVTAQKPAEGIIECDTDGVDDGKSIFNLTVKEAEIVNEQQGVSVLYYASMADYEAGKPIDTPAKYTNEQTPQEIIVEVRNSVKDSYCHAITSFTIEVQPIPEKPLIVSDGSTSEAYVCYDQDSKVLTPILIETGLSASLYDFRWFKDNRTFNAPNLPYLNVTEAGNYTVQIIFKGSKKDSCYSVSSNIIKVTISGELDIRIKDQDSSGMIGSLDENDGEVAIHIESPINDVSEDGTVVREYEYALNDGIFQSSRSFYNVPNGTHRVWVRPTIGAGKACPQYKDFFVLGYPKFFTPNGDGYNDTWNISALSGHPEAVIYIFDRYGKLLKQLSPKDSGWDGTFNGKPMPSTDYWFTVEYRADGLPSQKVSFKGHFSLKR